MERPALGLAYAKTAALPSWEDTAGQINPIKWLRTGPRDPAPPAPATPTAETSPTPAPAVQPSAPPAGQAASVPTAQQPAPVQKPPSNRVDAIKRRKLELALRRDRQRKADAIHGPGRRQSAATMDANIAAGTRRNQAAAGGNPMAREQARRERDGDWAWQQAQSLGARTMRGNPVNPGPAVNTPGYSVPGMPGYDLSHAVNRFQDNAALEGQNSRGMGDDEFQRYVGKHYPQQAAASREKYRKPEISNAPTYQWSGRTPGKKPIEWSPTTYEQAQRMGVLDGGKLKSPDARPTPPTMDAFGGGVSATLTTPQKQRAETGEAWKSSGQGKATKDWWADSERVAKWKDFTNSGVSSTGAITNGVDLTPGSMKPAVGASTPSPTSSTQPTTATAMPGEVGGASRSPATTPLAPAPTAAQPPATASAETQMRVPG